MATISVVARAFFTLGASLALLAACDKFGDNDVKWARAALERNPNLTIVASDPDARTFTVQEKDGGLRVIGIDEIVAGIASTGDASSSTAPPSADAIAPEDVAPAEQDALVEAAPAPAPPVAENAARGTALITNAATGTVLASSETAAGAAPGDAANAEAGQNVATKADGRVLVSGPGYSISAGDPGPSRPIRLASATEPRLRSPVRDVAVERRYEPLICQGGRLLHIDGRNLEFEGDAVRAEDGCELHITNSHIIARGVGISARAANVHIKNSIVEGDSGSVSASEGARVYVQSSTFKGLSRRLDSATFNDLGGNAWN